MTNVNSSDVASNLETDTKIETSRFASETLESERESLNAYKQATANATSAPQIVIDSPNIQGHKDRSADHSIEGQSVYKLLLKLFQVYKLLYIFDFQQLMVMQSTAIIIF